VGAQYRGGDAHRGETGRDAEKDGKPRQSHKYRRCDVAWKARMMAANAAKKKTPNALPRCFSFRSLFMRAVLIEAPPGLHRAMARRIAANVAKLPELLRKRSE
jgi:hypothetical protein